MTDHTQDVREIAEATIRRWKHGALNDGLLSTNDMRSLADAVLSAVTPVIRQQVAEEIAWAIEHPIGPQEVRWAPIARRWMAESAAIARSHALPEERTE